ESGGEVEQETLHFDPGNESAPPLRSKEEAQDYRYFPEPDLVPLEPERELVERLKGELPESPITRLERLLKDRGLEIRDAEALNANPLAVKLFEAIHAGGIPAAETASFLLNNVMPQFEDLSPIVPNANEIVKVLREREHLTRGAFDEAVAASATSGYAALQFTERVAIADVSELDPVIDRILSENEQQVEAYRGGKEGLLGFFVGQVMKETGGKANPQVVNERLREKLEA
ncbi:MAG TPA: hypothetical protein VMG74_02130, partial [Gaiellaceae bacterium]|nr:hypothetical protein [Gaiellaceae bacterium]